jgi:hypothetical protein
MFRYIQKAKYYFSQHVILGNIAHVLGGFGLAMLLQNYIQGNAFLPAWMAWIMMIIAVAIHVKAFMS